MDKIINFFREHKYTIIIIVALIIILWYWYRRNHKNEGFETLSDLVNKDVHLMYNDMYLGAIMRTDCGNIQDQNPDDCIKQIAVLYPKPKAIINNITFKLVYNDYSEKYELIHPIDELRLSQDLNYYKDVNKMCFDIGDDDVIGFDLEQHSTDKNMFAIKYRKPEDMTDDPTYKYYYLSECPESEVCGLNGDKLQRLCLTTDKSNAVYFTIQLASKQDEPVEESILSEIKVDVDTLSASGEVTMPNLYNQDTASIEVNSIGTTDILGSETLSSKMNDRDVESFVGGFEGFNSKIPGMNHFSSWEN